jgi:hypothetical protein
MWIINVVWPVVAPAGALTRVKAPPDNSGRLAAAGRRRRGSPENRS